MKASLTQHKAKLDRSEPKMSDEVGKRLLRAYQEIVRPIIPLSFKIEIDLIPLISKNLSKPNS